MPRLTSSRPIELLPFVAKMSKHLHQDDISQMTPEDMRAYCAAAPNYIDERDDFGYTPLLAACVKGNTEAVRVLLDAGSDPNFVAPDGETPLNVAISLRGEACSHVLLDMLLAAGANLNAGFTPPLRLAVVRGLRDLVVHLVERGADPNFEDGDGSPPLFAAGVYGGHPDVKMMGLLIKLGADITRCDGVGQTLADRIGPDAMREVMRHATPD